MRRGHQGLPTQRSLSDRDNDMDDVLAVLLIEFLLANDEYVTRTLLITPTRQWQPHETMSPIFKKLNSLGSPKK